MFQIRCSNFGFKVDVELVRARIKWADIDAAAVAPSVSTDSVVAAWTSTSVTDDPVAMENTVLIRPVATAVLVQGNESL